eukprot:3138146-Amphidinium_carterae.1
MIARCRSAACSLCALLVLSRMPQGPRICWEHPFSVEVQTASQVMADLTEVMGGFASAATPADIETGQRSADRGNEDTVVEPVDIESNRHPHHNVFARDLFMAHAREHQGGSTCSSGCRRILSERGHLTGPALLRKRLPLCALAVLLDL